MRRLRLNFVMTLLALLSCAGAARSAESPASDLTDGSASVVSEQLLKMSAAKQELARGNSAAMSPSQQARLQRARAAVAARKRNEQATPRYKVDETGALVPDPRAEAAIVYNPTTGEVLFEANAQNPRSIASLTKLMTAVVFLDGQPDLSQEVLVTRADLRGASTTYLRSNERVRVDDLLHVLLIASDNGAARVLARISPGGAQGFVERMNEKAAALALDSTKFTEPSGLSPSDVASAYDVARLIAFAANDVRISSIMRMSEHRFRTSRRRAVTVRNTNRLLRGGDVDVLGAKTGFIRQAGYCLAALLKLPHGDDVAVVVMGARSSAARFMEARHLLNWLTTRAGLMFGQSQQTQE